MSLPYAIARGEQSMRPLRLDPFNPTATMKGLDVWALQRALNYWSRAAHYGIVLGEDGIFGKHTDNAVRQFQKSQGIAIDGIAGPTTGLMLVRSAGAEVEVSYSLPRYMLSGIAANESGGWLGAVNDSVAGGKDLGAYQWRVPNADLDDWAMVSRALDVARAAEQTAADLRAVHKLVHDRVKLVTADKLSRVGVNANADIGSWQLAVLHHNYPYAVERIVEGKVPFTFTDIDGHARRSDEPAIWVRDASRGRLATAEQWCKVYIAKATTGVAW